MVSRRGACLLARRSNPWRSNHNNSSSERSSSPVTARASALPEGDDVDAFGHPRIPLRGHYEVHKCDARRDWVEQFTGASLQHLGQWWTGEGADDSCSTLKLKGNTENVIGLIKIPLGVAGPLLVNGRNVQGYHLCPFATTEGALIASATRGANAVTRAGGVWTDTFQQQLTRVPSFHCGSIEEAKKLWNWISAEEDTLKAQVKMYSQHAQLVALRPHFFGRVLMVQFVYDTGDAAGQNMTTSVTWHACKWILAQMATELPDVFLESFTVESNFSADKKVAAMNLSETRGTAAQAEAWVPESILESVLKVSTLMASMVESAIYHIRLFISVVTIVLSLYIMYMIDPIPIWTYLQSSVDCILWFCNFVSNGVSGTLQLTHETMIEQQLLSFECHL